MKKKKMTEHCKSNIKQKIKIFKKKNSCRKKLIIRTENQVQYLI